MNELIEASDLISAIPYLLLLCASLGPISIKVIRGSKEPSTLGASLFSLGIIVTAIIGILVAHHLLLQRENVFVFNQMLVLDGVSVVSSILVMLLSGFGLLICHENPTSAGRGFAELNFLIVNSVIGMLVVTQSANLLTLFVGLEMMALPIYVAIGMGHDNFLSKESAIKYYIVGSFGSAVFLMGIALAYGVTGTLSFTALIQSPIPGIDGGSALLTLGGVFIISGLLLKVSIVPFHLWTADVYQGAPTGVTAIMATGVKVASTVALFRMAELGFLGNSELYFSILEWLAVLTILVGNSAALWQSFVKRTLAFSSVAHSGYILIVLLAYHAADKSAESVVGHFLFYLISYSLASLGVLSFVSLMEQKEGEQLRWGDLKGFGKKDPVTALAVSIMLLSLAGLPPFLGFFAKLYVIYEALNQGLLWAIVWAMVGSVLGVYFYIRPIVTMFMENHSEGSHILAASPELVPQRFFSQGITVVVGVLVVALGVFHSPMLAWLGNLP